MSVESVGSASLALYESGVGVVAPVSQDHLLEEGHRVRLIRLIGNVKTNILDYSHQ